MDTPNGKLANGRIRKTPGGLQRDGDDWQNFRWNRQKDEGFPLSRFYQSVPLLFTADGHNVWAGDTYRGGTVFLIASGPSTKSMDLSLLRQPGIMTFGINNSPRVFRPNLWACVDSPCNFMRSIWLDPTITKFAPLCHTDKRLLDNDSGPRSGFKNGKDHGDGYNRWDWMDVLVRDCPNVLYYRRNAHFRADQFLWEDTFNWGNSKDLGGARSILLVAIRLCYVLGFQTVNLLGVDFRMSDAQQYAFEQDRSRGSIQGNQSTYAMLKERFEQLKPIFDAEGFNVRNCNPDSSLKVFPHVPLAAAVQEALLQFGHGHVIDVANENTQGLYDREDKQKKEHEQRVAKEVDAQKVAAAKEGRRRYTDADRAEAKAKLDAARALLDGAKKAKLDLLAAEPKGADATADALKLWGCQLADATRKEESTRLVFHRAEDRKRFLNGEPIRWDAWDPREDDPQDRKPL